MAEYVCVCGGGGVEEGNEDNANDDDKENLQAANVAG